MALSLAKYLQVPIETININHKPLTGGIIPVKEYLGVITCQVSSGPQVRYDVVKILFEESTCGFDAGAPTLRAGARFPSASIALELVEEHLIG